MRKSGKFGPLIGGVVGIIPQCGFSAAAASLFAGGVISAGTLLAIFLSTSDEMLPILISESVAPLSIIKILAVKALLGVISGFLIDLIWKKRIQKGHNHHMHKDKEIHDLCEHDHCHCEEDGIVKSAAVHTLQITFFIFVISFIIGLTVEVIGADKIGSLVSSRPFAGIFFAALVGLIPNCAASVVITQLYLEGLLRSAQMAGLLVGAGVGILVLFRSNKDTKENLKLTALLYACGVIWGIIIEISGIVF